MKSFAAIIDKFGGPATFASAMGISASHAGVMKSRNSVPPEYWPTLIKAAAEREIEGITADALIQLATDNAAKRRASQPAEART